MDEEGWSQWFMLRFFTVYISRAMVLLVLRIKPDAGDLGVVVLGGLAGILLQIWNVIEMYLKDNAFELFGFYILSIGVASLINHQFGLGFRRPALIVASVMNLILKQTLQRHLSSSSEL